MKILLLGKDGQLGRQLHRTLAVLGDVVAPGRQELDISCQTATRAKIRDVSPQLIVNAAAYTAVDRAEKEPGVAHSMNAVAPGVLASEALVLGARLVHYSTDYVFDGESSRPYTEEDSPNPQNVYGASKLAGERSVMAAGGQFLIFRTSWMFSGQANNFASTMLRLAGEQDSLSVVADQIGAPTSADFIADVTARILTELLHCRADEACSGIYHLTASGETSRCDYARFLIERATALGLSLKCRPEDVAPTMTDDFPMPARRPKNSRLSTSKLRSTFGIITPHWSEHVDRMLVTLAGQT